MNGSPLISVVIPVHNGEKTIAACLQSVLDSDYCRFEVIVVDDGSTDRTADRTEGFPCQVVRLRTNVGAAAARNKGA
jgi:glycosyltransferase involved in cell wall biosynthesis